MIMRYYYLLTSLPDLVYGADKPPITRSEFEQRLYENLAPKDRILFNLLRLRIDNKNLISLIKKEHTFIEGGIFSGEELALGLKLQHGLPHYMISSIVQMEDRKEILIEDLLWEEYLAYCISKNDFIKEYLSLIHI